MSIENIQKLWVLLGTLVATMGFPWIPEIVNDLLGVAGTEVVFKVVFAVAGLWQFVESRTGKGKEEEGITVQMHSKGASTAYMLNPFQAAA